MGDCTLIEIILKILATYIALSLFAGCVAVAIGEDIFAGKWLFPPPLLLLLAGAVFLSIAYVWWF